MSLRRAINETCRESVYDSLAAGTWRQQVTLCSATTCALWPHRATAKAKIPNSVLRYYGVESGDSQGSTADAGRTLDEQLDPHDDAESALSHGVLEEIREGVG